MLFTLDELRQLMTAVSKPGIENQYGSHETRRLQAKLSMMIEAKQVAANVDQALDVLSSGKSWADVEASRILGDLLLSVRAAIQKAEGK